MLNFIELIVKEGVNELHSYSDSCSGQNKNQFLYTMFVLASMKFGIKIIHRYGEKGHTQMECDSVHARIEKKTRHLPIFTPAEWYSNIRTAKVKQPHYVVKELNTKSVLSFKELAAQFVWSRVPITQVREISVEGPTAGIVKYKKEWDGPPIQVSLLPKKPGRPINWVTHKLKPAYSGKLALKPKVVNDLKWYMKKDFIPNAHLDYYIQLTQPPAPEAEQAEDGYEDEEPQEIDPNPAIPPIEILLEKSAEASLEEQVEQEIQDDPLQELDGMEEDGASIDSEVYD